MANANTFVKVGELIQWKKDVNNELEEVDKVLDEVSRVLKECEGDDTVYGAFKKLGEGIADAYISLSDVFRKTMDATKDIIEQAQKGIQTIGEKIQDTARKFGL